MNWAKCSAIEMPRLTGQYDYDERKDQHSIMASATAWERLGTLAKQLGYRSRSDLIEAIGRDRLKIEISEPKKTEE